MIFKKELPTDDIFRPTLLAYYDFLSNLYGGSIFSYFSKKNIKKVADESTFLKYTDDVYSKTIKIISTIYLDENFQFVLGFDNNNNYVGFARVKLSIEQDVSNAIVAEIVLINSDNLSPEEKENIYREFIAYIEQMLLQDNPLTQVLTFEIPKFDVDYANAALSLGYDPEYESSKEAANNVTHLFDKTIRGRDDLLMRSKLNENNK